MIAHVAQAGESKGRVVLQAYSMRPSTYAIEAAIWIARAFESEIEVLGVEDEQLIELAGFPFAREISLTGQRSRPIHTSDIERDMRSAFFAFKSEVEHLARLVQIPVTAKLVRGDRFGALAEACRQVGPWNMIVLAEPVEVNASTALRRLLAEITDATGVIIVGPKARTSAGPVVLMVEDAESLPTMLRTAERLGAIDERGIVVAVLAEDDSRLVWLEGDVRLVLSDRPEIKIVAGCISRGAPMEIAENCRRTRPGLVISQFGGTAIPQEDDLVVLVRNLDCPLLLVR